MAETPRAYEAPGSSPQEKGTDLGEKMRGKSSQEILRAMGEMMNNEEPETALTSFLGGLKAKDDLDKGYSTAREIAPLKEYLADLLSDPATHKRIIAASKDPRTLSKTDKRHLQLYFVVSEQLDSRFASTKLPEDKKGLQDLIARFEQDYDVKQMKMEKIIGMRETEAQAVIADSIEKDFGSDAKKEFQKEIEERVQRGVPAQQAVRESAVRVVGKKAGEGVHALHLEAITPDRSIVDLVRLKELAGKSNFPASAWLDARIMIARKINMKPVEEGGKYPRREYIAELNKELNKTYGTRYTIVSHHRIPNIYNLEDAKGSFSDRLEDK